MSIKSNSDDLFQSFSLYVLSVLGTTSLHATCELHSLRYADKLHRGLEWSLSLRDNVLWDTQKDLLKALFHSTDVGVEPAYKVESVPSNVQPRVWRIHLVVSDNLIEAYEAWLLQRATEAKSKKQQENLVASLRSEVKKLKRGAKK